MGATRGFETVKIWADEHVNVLLDGQPYTLYPDDGQPAIVQTDADGALTIISGSLPSNTDEGATDLFGGRLRVWASFMDPYERMVIYPDREVHNRLASAVAQPTDDNLDPDTINLSTT
jgi:hypothetical protein